MKYLFAILISFFILGCAKNENLEPKQSTQNIAKEDKPLVQANTPKKPEKLILPNSIYSSFHTILPCPNCEGIKTIITLNKDKTYTKTMLTMDKEISLVEKNGTFDVDDSAIILKDENGNLSYFAPNKNSLLQLDDKKNKRVGVLAQIYNFEPVNKAYKDSFFARFSKFKDKNGFLDIIITPSKNGARATFYSSLKNGSPICEFSSELFYDKGIFYLLDEKGIALSIHKINGDLFIIANDKICKSAHISGHYKKSKGYKNIFGKGFFAELTNESANRDVIKIYGSKNIKRDNTKKENSYIVTSKSERIFEYTLLNGIITSIEIYSNEFKTPENISLKSNFKDIKNSLVISKFSSDKNNIYLKIDSHDMLITLKNPLTKEITSLNDIPDETKIEQITLMWNQ
ncbi:copper resistance protein NlpE [Campylobacter concisus]|uniref:copper resistance protein NlpE n=1 Tax=Campylobacter concisus TaxID=199 RepID=UPI000D2FCB0B|nr:copper resistance protein NlpE [Campylobacter concisus]